MPNNLRIIYDNAADRATVTTSSSAGSLTASNLQVDKKSKVWRSFGSAARINTNFTNAEDFNFIGIPFINASKTLLMRVRLTNEASATNLLAMETDRCQNWGNAPASVRYVKAPDGNFTAVVPKTDSSTDRWEFSIPIGTYPNGTQLVISWHQKTVPDTGLGGQVVNPTAWVGATYTAINETPSVNGFVRRWIVVTITDNTFIQYLRFYVPVVGADDIACWGWMLTLGTSLTSYFPSLATFTSRTTIATYTDINGLVATAPAGSARMQYQYPSLATVAPRLLVEPPIANICVWSGDLTNAAWAKTGVTVTANVTTSPDGLIAADKVIESSGYSVHYTTVGVVTTVVGTVYTSSIFAKAGERTILQGIPGGSQFPITYANFDLVNGVVTATGSNGLLDANMIPYPNGWWRCYITIAATSAVSSIPIAWGPAISPTMSRTFGWDGDGTSGVYLWGGQVEVGHSMSSYIPTTSGPYSRAGDVATYAIGVRPLGYMDWWQSYDYDSGFITATPGNSGQSIGVNSYSYGGGAYARIYLPSIYNSKYIAIDLIDYSNISGYIEASRLVIGKYWSPTYNTTFGLPVNTVDTTTNERSEAGDLISTKGISYRTMSFLMPSITTIDLVQFNNLRRTVGKTKYIFVSLFPEDSNSEKESTWQMYGKQTDFTPITQDNPILVSSGMSMEEF